MGLALGDHARRPLELAPCGTVVRAAETNHSPTSVTASTVIVVVLISAPIGSRRRARPTGSRPGEC